MGEGKHSLSCHCRTDDLNSISVTYNTISREGDWCHCFASFCADCTIRYYREGLLVKGHLTDLIDKISGNKYKEKTREEFYE